MQGDLYRFAFNRGVISPLAMARVDLPRMRMSAETQTNWMPRALGPMMFRPGLAYLNSTKADAKAVDIPFVYSSTDKALIEMTASNMRVLVEDEPISRVLVSTAVTVGDFSSSDAAWVDGDESGATSTITGGKLELTGTRYNSAIRRQQVTVSGADQNKEHALRIVVERGPVTFRCGSSSGGEQYVAETELKTGTHSLAFTPTGNFWIEFSNRYQYKALVDSCTVEAEGDMVLSTPWPESALPLLRWDQSADVIFVACEGYQPRRIERRSTRSWSLVLYEPQDGPFRTENLTKIRLTPSGISGDVTVTSTKGIFRSGHVGAVFNWRSVGQKVASAFNGDNQFSDPIRIAGVGGSRRFYWTITGTWTGTVTIQYSIGEPGSWTDSFTFTANSSDSHNDDLDNQIVYYRIGIKSGEYGSGTANVTLTISSGSILGTFQVTSFSSETSVGARVLKDLGGTDGSEIWAEGSWSSYRGWPGSVAFHEGRLNWFAKGRAYQSVSDAYESFDPNVEGDSGPINRSIGQGPVDSINWALSLQRLLIGTASAELSIRSTSFDEVLTRTNWNLKPASTQGSAKVAPVRIDASGVYVQRSGTRVFELAMAPGTSDYAPIELTELTPEIGEPSISYMAVQRQPDTRVHCVRSDGKVAILVFNRAENVICWVLFETDGLVEGVSVLPGQVEDQVYYIVKRTINGVAKRYRERWALESQAVPGTICRCMDSHRVFEGVNGSNIGGLSHLEGKTVAVWADGVDLGTFTVASGQIDVGRTVQDGCVGLVYEAPFKSTKLDTAFISASLGLSLTKRKRVAAIGFVLKDAHVQGLKYGPSANVLRSMPLVEKGKVRDADHVWGTIDCDPISVPAEWDTDPRIYLKAQSPRPVTILAASVQLEAHG